MVHIKNFSYFLFITVLVASCKSVQPVISNSGGEANARTYIEQYKDLAISEMHRTGVPASITLAQGMIESDFGRSRLAREANNHFGIKCHSDWKGPTITHHDDKRNECFRKYSKPEESFYDHSDFLKSGSRYSFLFDLKTTDYKGWARGLKKAGYATNPDYSDMLIRKIEENSLYYYDNQSEPSAKANLNPRENKQPDSTLNMSPNNAAQSSSVNNLTEVVARPLRIKETNRIQNIIVRDGETREMIEKEFGLLKWELPKYNELDSDFTPYPGQLLYLQPKRDKAEPGKETHSVADGETLYSISQKYGIKQKSLIDFNRLEAGTEPKPGEKLWLRGPKPVR